MIPDLWGVGGGAVGEMVAMSRNSLILTLVIPMCLIHTRYKFQSNTTIYYTKYSYGNMFRLC